MDKKLRVCLITEGTYPYVMGGVSAWTHMLIKYLKDIEFEIIAIVGKKGLKPKYKLPENVVNVTQIPIVEEEKFSQPLFLSKEKIKRFITYIKELHEAFAFNATSEAADALLKIHNILSENLVKFWATKEGWEYLSRRYKERRADIPTVEWILSWKDIHIPLLTIISNKLPKADVYHGTNSGFAGLLAILGGMCYNRPSLLTDHGIFLRAVSYTHLTLPTN